MLVEGASTERSGAAEASVLRCAIAAVAAVVGMGMRKARRDTYSRVVTIAA